jgi:RNA polymerase sigma-70 factor, ECF subfamily
MDSTAQILSTKLKGSSHLKVSDDVVLSSGKSTTGESMNDYSDEELLKLFKEGDNPDFAFNLIVKKYRQKVYFHVRRMLVDHDDTNDVVQNTFIKAWKGLENYRAEAQLFTWLYRIATNESLTFLKKKKVGVVFSFSTMEKHLEQKLESSSYVDTDELVLKLQKAILRLPDKQKLVFNMRYYDELKYEEIAEITGGSIGGLKASYHHAVKKIKIYITTH